MKMLNKKSDVLLVLLLLVLLAFGCSRRRAPITSPNSPHVSGWLTEGSPNFHGYFVLRDGGPFVCAGCHTVSTTDSSSFCFKCHYGPSGNPHAPAWIDSAQVDFHGVRVVNYGLNVILRGVTRACQDCHYVDNTDTTSQCFRCHLGPTGATPKGIPSIPGHRQRWVVPHSLIFHGTYVRNVGYAYCKACHGDNFQGGKGPSCGTAGCHTFGAGYTFFPHQSSWGDSSSQGFHGRFVIQRTDTAAICRDCHGQDYKGGWSGVSCYDCHKYYPHPTTTWRDTLQGDGFHGDVVYRYGYDFCKVCHGDTSTNFNGGRSGKSCLSCHTGSVHGFTHPAQRWKLIIASPRFHGNQVGRDGFVPCATCHGANYDYSKGGLGHGCASGCHGDFSFKQYGSMPHFTAQWPQGDTLGPDTTHAWWVVKEQSGDTATCTHCHFPASHTWLDGRNVPNCATCHSSLGGLFQRFIHTIRR